jgi:hypothetical protein
MFHPFHQNNTVCHDTSCLFGGFFNTGRNVSSGEENAQVDNNEISEVIKSLRYFP